MREGVEAIAFLAGSETRVRLLEELVADGPLSRGVLRERLDAARTTITRNLEALVDRGWIREIEDESESRYDATPPGRLVADALSDVRAAVGTADRLGPFLRWFPASEPEPPIEPLRDARIVTGESSNPYAQVNAIVNRIRRSDDGRVLLPFLGLHAFEAIHERVIEDGTTHELVVTPAVAETLRTDDDYAPLFADLRACDRFAALVCDGEIPLFIGIYDGVTLIDPIPEGAPKTLVESDDGRVREWAEDAYRRYRAAARCDLPPVRPSGFPTTSVHVILRTAVGSTDEMTDDLEAIAFLAGSETRVRLLEELAGARTDERGTLSRGELRERLDAARTTITRNLEALIDRGWIRETEGRYAVTPSGRLIVDALDEAATTAAAATRLAPFLRWFPIEDVDLDPGALADASVWAPDDTDPYSMINRHVDTLREADRFRGMVPLVGLHAFEAVHERVVEGDADHELVVTPAVAETLRIGDYAPLFADLRACDRFAALVFDGEVPYYLGLIDEAGVEVGVDEDGTPRALLYSEAPDVREWAEDVYGRYRTAARPVGPE